MGRLAPAHARGDADDRGDLVAAVMCGPDVLAIVDADGTVRASGGGRAARAIAPGDNLLDAVHPEDAGHAATFLATVAKADPADGARGPVGWRLGRERPRHVEATATNRLDDPRIRGIVVSVRDVDDRAKLEAEVRHHELHDPLTDLPNRSLFYDRVEKALSAEGSTSALLYLDLDGFKVVNDRLGHKAGDAVLVEVSTRLRASLRAGDTAARLGGDEFGVLLAGVSGHNDAVRAAQRLLDMFSTPMQLSGAEAEPLHLAPSVGVAVGTGHEVSPDELLRRADVALGEAKRSPERSWALYDPASDTPSGVRRKRLSGWFARSHEQRDEVADILDREDALQAAFQPIVDLRTGMVAGYEALARFPRNPGRNPAEWFAQAHRCGLGFELEARALEAAFSVPGRPDRAFLSVNVSPSAFGSPAVQKVLPTRLNGVVVEITENEQISDDAGFRGVREVLRARGGRLAVDDTGAGYAGLRQLMRLAPDLIKLDRAVVDGVAGDPAKAALVTAMVRYAREIGAHVCAEGIETIEDLETLADLDVTYGQGWAIARPSSGWGGVSVDAASACRASFSASLRGASSDEVAGMRHDRRLEWLTWKLSEASSFRDLADAVESIAHELHADELSLSVVDEERQDLVFVGARGLELFDERYKIADYPTTEWILREQVTSQILVSDPAADPTEVEVLNRLGMRSVLILPVVCGGRSIGLFEAYSSEERPWSRFEMGRARVIAFQVGAALDRLQRLTV